MKTRNETRRKQAPTWGRAAAIPARRIPVGYRPERTRKRLLRELKDCGDPERAFARNAERLAA